MNDTFKIILFASAGGFPIVFGGLLSGFLESKEFKFKKGFNHWVIAFGGGALLAAIAFALVPQGSLHLSLTEMTITFFLGTSCFMIVDMLIAKSGSPLSQVLAMMMDSVPEGLALGASFAHNHGFGLLLAIFIGLQNLPEGFNSYLELNKRMAKIKTLLLLLILALTDVFAALFGEFLLADKPKNIAYIMIFASGGILYLIFQDIAPLSKARKNWVPATGASFGFIIGMMGERLIN
jgi:zinc transporter, ZIP family